MARLEPGVLKDLVREPLGEAGRSLRQNPPPGAPLAPSVAACATAAVKRSPLTWFPSPRAAERDDDMAEAAELGAVALLHDPRSVEVASMRRLLADPLHGRRPSPYPVQAV